MEYPKAFFPEVLRAGAKRVMVQKDSQRGVHFATFGLEITRGKTIEE